MICVSISHISQIHQAVSSGAALLEFRLDLIREDPGRIYAPLQGDVKSIATCRPEGNNDSERIELLKSCMDLGASYVDIELDSSDSFRNVLMEHAGHRGTDVILSYHNFEVTPGRRELAEWVESAFTLGGHVAKIATMARSAEDLRTLLSLYELPGRKVVIGMGEKGRILRVMAPYLGAEFTFASLDQSGETAPGQLNVNQLLEIYKVIDQS